jgi:hypothetical protein
MISQVLQLTLKPGVAGEVNGLLKRGAANKFRGNGLSRILVLENRNRRSVTVIATFKDKAALDAFFEQAPMGDILNDFTKLAAGQLDFYEALTEEIQ